MLWHLLFWSFLMRYWQSFEIYFLIMMCHFSLSPFKMFFFSLEQHTILGVGVLICTIVCNFLNYSCIWCDIMSDKSYLRNRAHNARGCGSPWYGSCGNLNIRHLLTLHWLSGIKERWRLLIWWLLLSVIYSAWDTSTWNEAAHIQDKSSLVLDTLRSVSAI